MKNIYFAKIAACYLKIGSCIDIYEWNSNALTLIASILFKEEYDKWCSAQVSKEKACVHYSAI